MLRWLAAASSSWSTRLMPICLAVIAWCSPIDSPVRGSLLTGISTPSWRGQLADQLQPVDVGLGPAQPEQGAAQVVAEARSARRRWCPRRPRRPPRSGPAAMPSAAAIAACSPVPHACCRSNAGVYGRQRAAEHAFAHQVEVAAVLEHRAADHRAQPLAGQTEPVDQPAQGGGEHVLVGRVGVGAVRARERNPVATEHRDAASAVLACEVSEPRLSPSLVVIQV